MSKNPLPAILVASACIFFSGCMSPEGEITHEFINDLPNHPKEEVRDKVVKWIAMSSKSARPVAEYQEKEDCLIVTDGDTEIKPEGDWVTMRMGFTLNVDVRNEKMRIRFTNLRRLYGSKQYDEPLKDEFFESPIAVRYHQAAQLRFNTFVQSLIDFIEPRASVAAITVEEQNALHPVIR